MSLPTLLRQAGQLDYARYRPQVVTAAVNALWPLGRDGALAALDAHLARHDLASDPQEGLLLVLRVLFEVPTPPGHQPPLRLGGATPAPPTDRTLLPHFPLVLVDDWPLLLVTGFALGGDVEPVTAALQRWRATGVLRARPLAPALAPDAVLARFEALYARAYGEPPPAPVLASITRQVRGG